jgi:hypothetical protein
MPWAGSLIVIVAIGFLIGSAIERGLFTPWMQFGLAMLISGAFIGVGIWKRATREDFGGILIGIGSCGVFLSIAGGQIFHHLYSKETLVGAFFAWGLANLGYSSFTKSRAFHVIGFLGGLGAALMPMVEQNVPVNVWLHFAIVIPAMFIAVRHRWFGLVTASWFVSSLALMPGLFSHADWMLRADAFAFNSLIAAIAYCRTFTKAEFDSQGVFPAIIACTAGLIAIFVRNDVLGAANIGAIAAAFGLAGYLLRRTTPGPMLALGGAIVGVVLSPFGFPDYMPAVVFAIYACACGLVSLRWKPQSALVLSVLASGGSMLMYLVAWYNATPLPWMLDVGLLVFVGGAACFSAFVGNRAHPNEESWTFAACAVGIPLVSRVAWIAGVGPLHAVLSPVAALVLAMLMATTLLAHFAGRKWVSANVLSWFTATCASLVYVATVLSASLPLPIELTLLLTGVGATLVLCRSTLPLLRDAPQDTIPVTAGLILLSIASRAAWIVALGPLASLIDPVSAVCLTWLGFAAVYTALTRKNGGGTHTIAWVAIFGSGFTHVGRLAAIDLGYPLHMTLLLSALAAVWVVGRRSISMTDSDDGRQSVIGLLGGLMGGLSAGAIYLTLAQILLVPPAPATIITLAVVSCGFSAYLALRRWLSTAILASGFAVASFVAYMWPLLFLETGAGNLSVRISRPLGVYALPMTVAVLTVVTLAAALSSRLPKLKAPAMLLAMTLNWPLFVQTGLLSLAGVYDVAHWNWLVSGFWVLYAVVLLGLGFLRDQRILRFGSFGIFGATIIKIFTWDLAQSIDPVLRVVILLGLGLAMLGGGYAYIRTRDGKDEIVEAGT